MPYVNVYLRLDHILADNIGGFIASLNKNGDGIIDIHTLGPISATYR